MTRVCNFAIRSRIHGPAPRSLLEMKGLRSCSRTTESESAFQEMPRPIKMYEALVYQIQHDPVAPALQLYVPPLLLTQLQPQKSLLLQNGKSPATSRHLLPFFSLPEMLIPLDIHLADSLSTSRSLLTVIFSVSLSLVTPLLLKTPRFSEVLDPALH